MSPRPPPSPASLPPSTPDSVEYPLTPHLRARIMGLFLVAVGLMVVLVTVLVVGLGVPPVVLSGSVVLMVVLVFVLGGLLTRRWYVVRLDPDGYRVRFVRGAGAKSARWGDVAGLSTTTVMGTPCVVLDLHDGRSTTIPVELFSGDREGFVRTLRQFLDGTHGYRRR